MNFLFSISNSSRKGIFFLVFFQMHKASNQSTTSGFEGLKNVRIQALNGLIKRRLSLARSYRDTVRRHDKVKNFSTTRFLTHEFEHGRLGNWMFQAASLIGIARQNHRVPIILKSQKERSQLFEAFHLTLVDPGSFFSTTAGELSVFPLPNSKAAIYDATTENLTATCHCQSQMMVLSGYLQSWKYFNTSRDEIRQMFTFRQGIYNRAMKHIKVNCFHQQQCFLKLTFYTDIMIWAMHFFPVRETCFIHIKNWKNSEIQKNEKMRKLRNSNNQKIKKFRNLKRQKN